jgi:hypothetical protein
VLVEVVAPRLLVGRAVAQQAIGADQDAMGDRDRRLVFAALRDQPVVLGTEVGALGPVRPDTRSWIAVADGENTEERFSGHRSYLAGKPNGDQSMIGTPEAEEGVYSEDRQDPRGMVKAGLPEAQSPVMQGPIRRSASDAATSTVTGQAGRSVTSFGRRTLANEARQGDERATYPALGRPQSGKQGIALRPRGRG